MFSFPHAAGQVAINISFKEAVHLAAVILQISFHYTKLSLVKRYSNKNRIKQSTLLCLFIISCATVQIFFRLIS